MTLMNKMFAHQFLHTLIRDGYANAKHRGHNIFLIEHILSAYMKYDVTKDYFTENCYDYDNIVTDIEDFLNNNPLIETRHEEIKISPEIELFINFFLTGYACNEEMTNMKTDTLNFMLTISSFLFLENTYAEKILTKNGITFDIIIELYQKYNAENLIQNKLQPLIENIMNENSFQNIGSKQ